MTHPQPVPHASQHKHASGGSGGSAQHVPPLLRSGGALVFLRILDLSRCRLSTHGVIPVLEAVANHAQCLAVLLLRGNALDDAGAGALAGAIVANAQRTRDTEDSGSVAGRPAAVPFVSSLRVVDIRDNPLGVASDPTFHPGCAALVRALADTPSLLTLTGPAPSLESLAALHSPPGPPSPAGISPVVALPDAAIVGAGSTHVVDLLPMLDTARALCAGWRAGSSLPDTRVRGGSLDLPPLYAEDVLTLTCARVTALLRAAAGVNPAALLGTGVLPPAADPSVAVAWSLCGPLSVAVLSGPRLTPLLTAHPRQALAREEAASGAGEAASAVDASRAPLWLEWQAAVVVQRPGGGASGGMPPSFDLSWAIDVCSPDGSACEALPLIASAGGQTGGISVPLLLPYSQGSRDRTHARELGVARSAALAASTLGAGGAHSLAPPADATWAVRRGGDWRQAVGVDHPSTTAVVDVADSGSGGIIAAGHAPVLLTWPTAWFSVCLPPQAEAWGPGTSLRLSFRLCPRLIGSATSAAAAAVVHVLDAEIVAGRPARAAHAASDASPALVLSF